jgi:hypothetical protein
MRAFQEAIYLCELIKAFSTTGEIVAENTPASRWLGRRMSDICYFLERLRSSELGDHVLEDELATLLKPIKDFVELNKVNHSVRRSGSEDEDRIPDGYDDELY